MNDLSMPLRCTVWVSRELQPLYPQFLDIQYRHMRELEQAMADGHRDVARRLAHNIKGAAASYELTEAAAMAHDLEAALVAADQAQAGRLLKQLVRHLTHLDIVFADIAPLPDI